MAFCSSYEMRTRRDVGWGGCIRGCIRISRTTKQETSLARLDGMEWMDV